MKTVHVLVVGIFIGLLAAAVILIVASEPRGKPIELVPVVTPSEIIVYISGAVNLPGVYHLSPGSRVEQAVEAADGLAIDADQSRANLAAILVDGEQVYIPKLGEISDTSIDGAMSTLPGRQIDINTATVEELDAIPGIGIIKAQSIITYRQSHGAFTSLENLLNVPGIGPALLEQITPYITIDS